MIPFMYTMARCTLNSAPHRAHHFCSPLISVYVIVWFRVQFGKKTYTSEFFKDVQNWTSPKDECNLKSLKTSRVYVFQIGREIILLLINDIHKKYAEGKSLHMRGK